MCEQRKFYNILFVALLLAAPSAFARTEEPNLDQFSNRTQKVLRRIGILSVEELKVAYLEGGRRKFANLAGLGNKGLKEIEDAVGAWDGSPELRPLSELGLSTRVINLLQGIDNIRNLSDLKVAYEKYGRRLSSMNHLGDKGLNEILEELKLDETSEKHPLDESSNITLFKLSNRTVNALWHKGVRTLIDLKQLYAECGGDLKEVPGLGPKSVVELEEFLGVDQNRKEEEPKISPRTKGKLNELNIQSLEELKSHSLLWFKTHFREKGMSELLAILDEKYGFTPYRDELERAIVEERWEERLVEETMNVQARTLRFMGFNTVGDLYLGYKKASSLFLRYEQKYDVEIRARLKAAETHCARLLLK